MYYNYSNIISLDILLKQLGISAVDKGNRYKARCPNRLHIDNTASWNLYKNTNYHICFSCGFAGNISTLVKYLTGKSIWEFLNIKKPETYFFNMSLDNKNIFIETTDKGINNSNGNLYKITEKCNNNLVSDYIKKRRLSQEFIDYFEIGYVTEDCYFNTTPFRYRIIIPVYENGIQISVEGKDYTGNQKPKVLYPKGGTVNTLFNIDNLDLHKPLIVVEGIFDMHLIWSNISKNVTSTFGSVLSKKQIELLNKFDTIIMMPDNDDAGFQMIKDFDKDSENEFEVALLPENVNDPGEATIDVLKESLNNRITGIEYFMQLNGLINNKKITW